MPGRTTYLANNNIYHVCNKSIEGFKIFNDKDDYERMLEVMEYYMYANLPLSFSAFKNLNHGIRDIPKNEHPLIVRILGYCLMPTHIHLILQQTTTDGITSFMHKISNSYTRYFNTKIKRKGPLWVSRFTSIRVENDEQLLHLTRYVHLNPTTAFLVDTPESWPYSSYNGYVTTNQQHLCPIPEILNLSPHEYSFFTKEHIEAQRSAAKIKHLLL